MGDFANIINRLGVVRDSLVNAINDQGGTADESMTFAQLSSRVYQLPVGIQYVRNGYQLFKGNDTMTSLPDKLDFRSFDSMYQMCYKCTALSRVPRLETANVTNMMWAFYGCSSLTEIDGLDTSNIISASEMFHGCTSLTAIYSPLDFSNVASQIDTTFTSCKSLVEVRFKGTINVDIAMNGCPKLSVDSMLSLFNALCDTAQDLTCKIGNTNLSKLTSEQKAIATDKGWKLM